MTTVLPPVAIEDGDDPFLGHLEAWFDVLIVHAINYTGDDPRVLNELATALAAITHTDKQMVVALNTLIDVTAELIRAAKPGLDYYAIPDTLDLDQLSPGWVHGIRVVFAAASGDDTGPFLRVAGDGEFARHALASILTLALATTHHHLAPEAAS